MYVLQRLIFTDNMRLLRLNFVWRFSPVEEEDGKKRAGNLFLVFIA